ncbi:MAG: TIGR03643 family protein [Opitutaceae bacterium]
MQTNEENERTARRMKTPKLDDQTANQVVRMGWEDRTTLEEIEDRMGLCEAEVIAVMRHELKPSSFRLWRKRVSGRVTKHRKKLKKHLRAEEL